MLAQCTSDILQAAQWAFGICKDYVVLKTHKVFDWPFTKKCIVFPWPYSLWHTGFGSPDASIAFYSSHVLVICNNWRTVDNFVECLALFY